MKITFLGIGLMGLPMARLTALGVHHIDCPVSGGTVGVEAGTLVMMVGGLAAPRMWARMLRVSSQN